MDRCALFVDAGYALADGAMAVHGTRRQGSVSWDHAGLLKLLAGLARDRTGLPVLRCYWYETVADGARTVEHDALAEMPGLKLRLVDSRPGRREGIESQLRRDLLTLAKNGAISDAFVASSDEHVAEIVAEVQDLGIRVVILHISANDGWTIPQSLRQECDDIVEISGVHLRPHVELIRGAEPTGADEHYGRESAGAPRGGEGEYAAAASARTDAGDADPLGAAAAVAPAGAAGSAFAPAVAAGIPGTAGGRQPAALPASAGVQAGTAMPGLGTAVPGTDAYGQGAAAGYRFGDQPYGDGAGNPTGAAETAGAGPVAGGRPGDTGSAFFGQHGAGQQGGAGQTAAGQEMAGRGGAGAEQAVQRDTGVGEVQQGNSGQSGPMQAGSGQHSLPAAGYPGAMAYPVPGQFGGSQAGAGSNGAGSNGAGSNGAGANGSGQRGAGPGAAGQNGTGQNGTDQYGFGQNGAGPYGIGPYASAFTGAGTGDAPSGSQGNGHGPNGQAPNGHGPNGQATNGSYRAGDPASGSPDIAMNGYQADTTHVGPYRNGADRNAPGPSQGGFNPASLSPNGTTSGDQQNGALGNGSRQTAFGSGPAQQNGREQNGTGPYQAGPQGGGHYGAAQSGGGSARPQSGGAGVGYPQNGAPGGGSGQPGPAPGGAQPGSRPAGYPGAAAQPGYQNGYPVQNGYQPGTPAAGPYQGGQQQGGQQQGGAAPFGGYQGPGGPAAGGPGSGGPGSGASQQARPLSGQGFEAAPVPVHNPPYRPYEQAPYPGQAAGEPARPGFGPGQGQPGAGFTPPGQYQAQYPGQEVAQAPPARPAQPAPMSLPDAVRAAHAEGFGFGESVGRDAPGLWLEAVLARKPRMPSDLEARLLQGSALPIDSLLHDEVRHSLRRGFWEALENARR